MQNSKRVTSGIVLRETETKETDKILTVLTPDLGKISLIARGARRKNSRLAASCQLLAYSEMTLYERGNWYYLDEAGTIELFDGVRQDFEKLCLASYLAELTESVSDGIAAPEILSLLLNALYALSALNKEPLLVKTAFELRLMALSGFEPFADGCAVCGKPEPERPMLDVVQGVLHCAACRQKGGLSLPLTAGSVATLRHVLGCDSKKLYSFRTSPLSLRQLSHASEAFAAAQLERSFRTLDYYKTIRSSQEEDTYD
ncbi:MAG: DNA repair protein RecO [Clostridiales bacterium]|nr:DNA repair protein RecO [Candidatus Cacconaster stercorequi]